MTPRKSKPAPEFSYIDETVAVAEEALMSEPAGIEETPRKRGRKASPLTTALRDFDRAKKSLDRAQNRVDKVEQVHEELAYAQDQYSVAKDALDKAYGEITA